MFSLTDRNVVPELMINFVAHRPSASFKVIWDEPFCLYFLRVSFIVLVARLYPHQKYTCWHYFMSLVKSMRSLQSVVCFTHFSSFCRTNDDTMAQLTCKLIILLACLIPINFISISTPCRPRDLSSTEDNDVSWHAGFATTESERKLYGEGHRFLLASPNAKAYTVLTVQRSKAYTSFHFAVCVSHAATRETKATTVCFQWKRESVFDVAKICAHRCVLRIFYTLLRFSLYLALCLSSFHLTSKTSAYHLPIISTLSLYSFIR